MKVIIAAEDAYRIIRDRRNAQLPLRLAESPAPEEIGGGAKDVDAAGIGDLASVDKPLHILAPKERSHTRSARIRQHLWEGPLPEGCLFATDKPDVLLEAPPLLTLDLARSWSLGWLVMLACEMCGSTSAAEDGHHFLQREAVSSISDFEDLLSCLRGRHGAKAYRKVVEAAANDCASPLEAEARSFLCLPVDDGGFGTGSAESNLMVVVTDPDGNKHIRYLDIAWRLPDKTGVEVIKGVEVDGAQHNASEARTGDHVRSYELRSSGIEELRCDSSVLSSQKSVTKFGESVRSMLGLDPIRMTKRRTQARMGLCQSIQQSPWHGLRLQK